MVAVRNDCGLPSISACWVGHLERVHAVGLEVVDGHAIDRRQRVEHVGDELVALGVDEAAERLDLGREVEALDARLGFLRLGDLETDRGRALGDLVVLDDDLALLEHGAHQRDRAALLLDQLAALVRGRRRRRDGRARAVAAAPAERAEQGCERTERRVRERGLDGA